MAGRCSLLLGLQTFHPFNFAPSWSQIALLPWTEQVLRMGDPGAQVTPRRES